MVYKRKYSLNEKFKKVASYKGYNIFDTRHSEEEFLRFTSKPLEDYKEFCKKVINWLIKNNLDKVEDKYIFIPKNTKEFGIQLEWRKDRVNKSYNGYSATTLSSEEIKGFVKYDDKKIFIEKIQDEMKVSEDAATRIFEKAGFYAIDTPLKSLGLYTIFSKMGNIFKNFEIIEV